MQTAVIECKLPSLNEYIRACNRNAHCGNRMKQTLEEMIMWQMGRLRKIKTPCYICFEWHEKTKKRDKDNVAFGKKFILDAMQKAEKLQNDNNRCVIGFSDRFVYGDWQGVVLLIWEDGDNEGH